MTLALVITFVALAVGCLTGALLIFLRTSRAEGGFLDLKLSPDWPPITMVVDPSLMELEQHILKALKEAASWWEAETGRRYFVPLGELSLAGHVIPILEAPADTTRDPETVVAYVEIMTNGSTMASAAVYLMPMWRGKTQDWLAQVFKHELGHCLGLAHDESSKSIMYSKVDDRGQFVTQEDIRALQQLFPKLPGDAV